MYRRRNVSVSFSGGETYHRFVYALQQCKRRNADKAMHTCVPWLIAHTRSNPAGAKNQVKANSVVGLHAARQAGCSPPPACPNPQPCLLSCLLVSLRTCTLTPRLSPFVQPQLYESCTAAPHNSTIQRGTSHRQKKCLSLTPATRCSLAGPCAIQCVFYPP